MYDTIIIRTGVSGAASARELSRYKTNVCVLERKGDVCCGMSKASSAIVHTGYDAVEGSLIARLSMEGNQIMLELAKELDFPFNPYGPFVVCLDGESLPDLRALYERGVKNGVKDLEIVTDEVRTKETEPNLADEAAGALHVLVAGIVCPFNLNIALAENAYINDVDLKLSTEVTDIHRIEDRRALETNQGVYETRCVVGAAGVYTDKFHNTVSETKIYIIPRRRDYCLLDRSAGNHVSHTIFALPGKYEKGALTSPTVHDDLTVGPTTIDTRDKEVIATTKGDLDELTTKTGMNIKDLPIRQVITSFAGFRAHEDHHEFTIKELKDTSGFVDYVEIELPGLTSCPAIGRMAAGILKKELGLESNPQFDGSRKGILDPDTLTKEEQAELIRQNPAYENIVCRYEMVTEGGILDAIHRPLGVRSLGGIRRRTRAGMGRYQAGFYAPRFVELFHRELGFPMTEITKVGGDSKPVVGANRDRI